MTYSFEALAPADFEDLARDLVGKELKRRFEAFGPGPDGGIDGRHAKAGKTTILQAKHYCGSPYSALKSVMKREAKAVTRLAPVRYVLATSQNLTPKRKEELQGIIGPALQETSDIFTGADLNGLLRKFPEITKSHIKLWLSSAALLERVVQSPAYGFTAVSRAEIEAKVKVYAPNPSFAEARDKLEDTHVVIIFGPPGVGKTTLAEMLAYAYIGEEWEFRAIRSLEDGFANIVDARRQVFFFDDFLGTVALDARSLANKDAELAKFIKRVRNSPNARFILTTRAYILEEARQSSEHLSDKRLDISRFLLDVGVYTRKIKARILYNHLVVARTPRNHVRALVESKQLPAIVDHKNYNPRIIEAMTDAIRLRDITAEHYPAAFVHALDNPHQIWDTAFRKHIPPMCRHLLISLFFCSEYGVELDELRKIFNALHPALCATYGLPHDPKDFEHAVRVVEGSFAVLYGLRISFVNPSVRDYLKDYLSDIAFLSLIARSAQYIYWARAAWRHVRDDKRFTADDRAAMAKSLLPFARNIPRLPTWKQEPQAPHYIVQSDDSNTDRIELLFEWAEMAQDQEFCTIALEVGKSPVGGFSSWRDGRSLPEMIVNLENEYYGKIECSGELSDALRAGLLDLLDTPMSSDDLESVGDVINSFKDYLGTDIVDAMNRAIVQEIDNARDSVREFDSESSLNDHARILQKLAERAGVASDDLQRAMERIDERIGEIAEEKATSSPVKFTGSKSSGETFDDEELRSLFVPLLSE